MRPMTLRTKCAASSTCKIVSKVDEKPSFHDQQLTLGNFKSPNLFHRSSIV